jgi:hypothetical protein
MRALGQRLGIRWCGGHGGYRGPTMQLFIRRRHRLAALAVEATIQTCTDVRVEARGHAGRQSIPLPLTPRSSSCRASCWPQGCRKCLRETSRVATPGPLQSIRFLLLGEASSQRNDAQLLLRAHGGGPSAWMQNYQTPTSFGSLRSSRRVACGLRAARGKPPEQGLKAVSPSAVDRQRCDALARQEFSQHLPRRCSSLEQAGG